MTRLFFIILFIHYSCSKEDIQLINNITLDCIESEPLDNLVLENPYYIGTITPTKKYPPFSKKLDVYGITLVASEDVSNKFVERVAKTIEEIFVTNAITDTLKQKEILTNLYRFKTIIPLFYGEDWYDRLNDDDKVQFELLYDQYSLCDIIMEGIENPVMEVVEHILHHITDIGLHYTYPGKWGLSTSSSLLDVTHEAISKNYYNIDQYNNEILDVGIRNRIILQEYAYWIIYTSWDLRNQYGPRQSEWSLFTGGELQANLKGSYTLFQETIPYVMTCPTKETLDLFLE